MCVCVFRAVKIKFEDIHTNTYASIYALNINTCVCFIIAIVTLFTFIFPPSSTTLCLLNIKRGRGEFYKNLICACCVFVCVLCCGKMWTLDNIWKNTTTTLFGYTAAMFRWTRTAQKVFAQLKGLSLSLFFTFILCVCVSFNKRITCCYLWEIHTLKREWLRKLFTTTFFMYIQMEKILK